MAKLLDVPSVAAAYSAALKLTCCSGFGVAACSALPLPSSVCRAGDLSGSIYRGDGHLESVSCLRADR